METLRNFGYTPPKVMEVWGEMIFRISIARFTRLVFLGSNVDFPGCILICSGFFSWDGNSYFVVIVVYA